MVLTPDERESAGDILDQHAPGHAAFVFGSRVVTSMQDQRRVKLHFDLDIAVASPFDACADESNARSVLTERLIDACGFCARDRFT